MFVVFFFVRRRARRPLMPMADAHITKGSRQLDARSITRSSQRRKPRSRIPHVVHQTWPIVPSVASPLGRALQINAANSPSFVFRVHDDAAVSDFFLSTPLPHNVSAAFHALNPDFGAARSDLWRYSVLWKFGGVYLDLDVKVRSHIDRLIHPSDPAVLVHEYPLTEPYRNPKEPHYDQWFLAFEPHHPYLEHALRKISDSILRHAGECTPKCSKLSAASCSKQRVMWLTGPDAFSAAVNEAKHALGGPLHRSVSKDDVNRVLAEFRVGNNVDAFNATRDHRTFMTRLRDWQRQYTLVHRKHYSKQRDAPLIMRHLLPSAPPVLPCPPSASAPILPPSFPESLPRRPLPHRPFTHHRSFSSPIPPAVPPPPSSPPMPPSPPSPPSSPPPPSPPPCISLPHGSHTPFLLHRHVQRWSGLLAESCASFDAQPSWCDRYRWINADPLERCCMCGGGTYDSHLRMTISSPPLAHIVPPSVSLPEPRPSRIPLPPPSPPALAISHLGRPASALYAAAYAQHLYNQQCAAHPLYDSGCPGYANAYYNQQCEINPLYDGGCKALQPPSPPRAPPHAVHFTATTIATHLLGSSTHLLGSFTHEFGAFAMALCGMALAIWMALLWVYAPRNLPVWRAGKRRARRFTLPSDPTSCQRLLQKAAADGDDDAITALLDAGVSVDAADTKSKFTALHIASNNGHCSTVRLLLDQGASWEATTARGRTALELARGQSHSEVVTILQPLGA